MTVSEIARANRSGRLTLENVCQGGTHTHTHGRVLHRGFRLALPSASPLQLTNAVYYLDVYALVFVTRRPLFLSPNNHHRQGKQHLCVSDSLDCSTRSARNHVCSCCPGCSQRGMKSTVTALCFTAWGRERGRGAKHVLITFPLPPPFLFSLFSFLSLRSLMQPKPINRAGIEEMLTRRFFFRPSFEIYNGVAGT